MRRILRGPDDGRDFAESLQVWGVAASAKDFAEAPFEVWPENVTAIAVFRAMSTQWNVGMSGATGLRYEALPLVLRLHSVPRAEWQDVFDGVRVMETEALSIWRERAHG